MAVVVVAACSPKGKNAPHKNRTHGVFSISKMTMRKKRWEQFVETLETDIELQGSSITKCGTLPEYFKHIEKQASKLLKESDTILFKRNESRLLRDGKFLEWSKKFFKVCVELQSYMSLEEVKAHNKKIFKRNLSQINKKIIKARSDLEQKLILRKEKGKHFDEKSLTLEIRKEWKRLLKVMPLEDIVVYSLNVLKKYKLNQLQWRQKRNDKLSDIFDDLTNRS